MEDAAILLGQERANLDRALAGNTQRIKELLPVALDAGISLDALAKLVNVSRQTLHQWRLSGTESRH